MSLMSNFLSKISIDKITKKTLISVSIILLHLFDRSDEINLIIILPLLFVHFLLIYQSYI